MREPNHCCSDQTFPLRKLGHFEGVPFNEFWSPEIASHYYSDDVFVAHYQRNDGLNVLQSFKDFQSVSQECHLHTFDSGIAIGVALRAMTVYDLVVSLA